MPFGDELGTGLLRMLLYGSAKLKKTWYAATAAKLGYNVLLFDGDDGSDIIRQLKDPAAQRRIRTIKCKDHLSVPVFAPVMVRVLKGDVVTWDDTAARMVSLAERPLSTHNHFKIQTRLLTSNDVLVIDSWSKFVYSTMWTFYVENKIDITKAAKQERDCYGYQSRILDWALGQLNSLPCHVIVIAHEEVVDRTRKELDEKDRVIAVPTGEQRTQMTSSSRAHSEHMPSKFSDVLHFYMTGHRIFINSRPQEGVEGGSRNVHDDAEWDAFPISRFFDAVESTAVPDAPMPGCEYIPAGQAALPQAAPAPAQKPTNVPVGNGSVSTIAGAAPAQAPVVAIGQPSKPFTLNFKKQ